MAATGKDSGAVDELLAGAFATGATVRDAAARAGVSESTARRRRPKLAGRILELARSSSETAADVLAGELTKSVRFLATVRDGTAPESRHQLWARVQAATTLANMALRHVAEDDPASALASRFADILDAWRLPPADG